MITIKNMFITTIASLFFGGCSLYNILQLNKHYVSQIETLQNKIDEYSKKQIILENKYIKIKEEVNVLMSTIIELEKTYAKKTLLSIENEEKEKDIINTHTNITKDNISEKPSLIDFDCAEIINYEADTSLKLEYVNNNYNIENCLRSRSSSITELNLNRMARLLFG
jgi:hypothetical protein